MGSRVTSSKRILMQIKAKQPPFIQMLNTRQADRGQEQDALHLQTKNC